MAKLMEVIDLVRRRLNPSLKISKLLACMYDSRTRLSSEVLAEVKNHFGELLAETKIRANVKLAEAPSFGLTIFEHAPDSNGAWDHENFAREYLGMPLLVEEDEDEGEEETVAEAAVEDDELAAGSEAEGGDEEEYEEFVVGDEEVRPVAASPDTGSTTAPPPSTPTTPTPSTAAPPLPAPGPVPPVVGPAFHAGQGGSTADQNGTHTAGESGSAQARPPASTGGGSPVPAVRSEPAPPAPPAAECGE
jgi:hypothetical protein